MASDYYEVFGVAPDADTETIKQRYRILVRENHPDVSSSEDAHARMQLILEAWSVLSQPDARARYDLSRREAGQRATAQRATAQRASNGTTAARSTPGTKRPASTGASTRKHPPARPKVDVNPRASNPRTKLLTMVFEAAQLYHQEGNSADAISLCNRVLKSDPKSSEAAALLGDIYNQQNRTDLALLMYKRAMQNQPNNLLYRQKWEALQQKAGAAETVKDTPVATPAPAAPKPSTPKPSTVAAGPSTPAARGAGCGAGVLLCCGGMSAGVIWLLQLLV